MNETTLAPDGYKYESAMSQPIGCPAGMYVDINLDDESILPNEKQRKDRDLCCQFCIDNNLLLYVGKKLMNDDLKLGTKQYPTSSTSKKFRDDQVNPNMQFLRIFFDWGSDEEMHQEEHELLVKYRTGNKDLFYNLDNQRSGTKKVDYDKINKMVDDLNKLRTNFFDAKKNSFENNYKDSDFNYCDMTFLYEPEVVSKINEMWEPCQTRAERINKPNLTKIKSLIVGESGRPSRKAKAPIMFEDVYYALDGKKKEFFPLLGISGNHTMEGYMTAGEEGKAGMYKDSSKLAYVSLPKHIGEQFTDAEKNEISNELNAETEHQAPFSEDDFEKECWDLIARGNSWGTPIHTKSAQRKGLINTQINKVFRNVQKKLDKKKAKNAGVVIPDYDIGGVDRWLLEDFAKPYDDGKTLIYYSSLSTIKPNEVLVGSPPSKIKKIPTGFKRHNEWRKSQGLEPYTKIMVVGFCNTSEIEETWVKKLKPQFKEMWDMAEGGNFPPIDYIIALREISQIQYNDKKSKLEKTIEEQKELEEYNKAYEEALEINKKIDELDRRDEVPIAWGEIEDGRMVVDCPICGDKHSHGTMEGGRVPHCSNNIHVKDNDPIYKYRTKEAYDDYDFWVGTNGIPTRKHKGAPVNKYYYPPTMYDIKLRKKKLKKAKQLNEYVL